MRKTYLYQLFYYSKPAFILVVVFIFFYALFFAKKMDMLLFPHNSMFAYKPAQESDYSKGYALRLNDAAIQYAAFPYWKKDFIESSLYTYAKYINQDKRVYLQQYFDATGKVPEGWQQKLVPSQKQAAQFLPWLIHFTGTKMDKNAKIELYEYQFAFQNGNVVIKDSLLFFSKKTFMP